MWNGSGKSASGLIGAGGVIRDSSGVWIAGFAVNLGQGQILEVEVWGLYFGLSWPWTKVSIIFLLRWMLQSLCLLFSKLVH